jgi:hypothetical protein
MHPAVPDFVGRVDDVHGVEIRYDLKVSEWFYAIEEHGLKIVLRGLRCVVSRTGYGRDRAAEKTQ